MTKFFSEEGGTEVAPLSTTSNIAVAIGFAVKERQSNSCLLFRIVTDIGLQRGAGVKFLSMFSFEEEFLYPPLAFLQGIGRRQG